MGTFVSGSCGLDCEVGERTVAGQQEQRPLQAGAEAVEFGEWVTRGRRPRSLRMVSVARRKGRASLISGSGRAGQRLHGFLLDEHACPGPRQGLQVFQLQSVHREHVGDRVHDGLARIQATPERRLRRSLVSRCNELEERRGVHPGTERPRALIDAHGVLDPS